MLRSKPIFAGLGILVLSGALWFYLTYDLLRSWSNQWFYRVNALWHEHPEPDLLFDPVFLISVLLEAAFVFGSAAFVTAWLAPRHPWGSVVFVLAVGSVPTLLRAVLIAPTEAPWGFKGAFVLYVLSVWSVGLLFAQLATWVRPSDKLLPP